jgi:O-antigen ligase
MTEEFSSVKKAERYPKKTYIDIFLAVCVAVIIFPILAGADSYLYDKGLLPISYPSFFLLLSIFIPVSLKQLTENKGQELLRIYQNTLPITVPFGLIAFITLAWGLHPGSNWEENGREIFFTLYHFVLLIFCVGLTASPTIRKYHRLIILTALLGTCMSISADVISPGTFSSLEARAAGFMTNANDGAWTTLYLTIGSINWKKNDLLNLFVFSIAGLAIFATLSVGASTTFMIVVSIYIALSFKKKSMFLKKMAFLSIFLLLINFIVIPAGIDMFKNSASFSHSDANKRVQKMINLIQGDAAYVDDHERVELIEYYIELIKDAPLVGHGTGYIPHMALSEPHNMYLMMSFQNGILGILAYLSLLYFSFCHFMLLKDQRGMVLIFVICGAGFFDHNLLTTKPFIGLLGILGALANQEYSKSPNGFSKSKLSW